MTAVFQPNFLFLILGTFYIQFLFERKIFHLQMREFGVERKMYFNHSPVFEMTFIDVTVGKRIHSLIHGRGEVA